jgi:peroxiredoxin
MAPRARGVMWIFLFAAFGIFALAGCEEAFFEKKKTPAPAAETYTNKLRIETPAEPIPAPDFILEDLSGRRVSLEDFKGKVVFLNFWATWCPPCVLEMPSMEKLHNEFANEGLVMLALNFRESRDQVKAFVEEHKLTFTVLLDPAGSVSELYQVWGLPVTTIINRRREIVGKALGSREWYSKESREFFRELLAENS